jgi:large subunit ribosomal protein L25
MAIVELAATIRQGIGKQANRKAKHAGRVPGVIYGKGLPSRNLEFERRPLEKYLSKAKHGTVIVKMSVLDGAESSESFAVLKEFQFHPVTDSVTHVDFYEVAAGKKFNVEVPLRVKGKPAGVEFGGILEVMIRSLEIRCTPDNVPEFIEIDVSGLNLGDTLHLGALAFPEGVKPVEKDLKMAIAAVHTPKDEAVKVTEEGAAVEAPAAASVAEPAKKGKG